MPAVDARGWGNAFDVHVGVKSYTVMANGGTPLEAGVEYELWKVFATDKPCIATIDSHGTWSSMYDSDLNEIDFASDDFCEPAAHLVEYAEATDPGEDFGPNRVWLQYSGDRIWSVMATWDQPVYTFHTGGEWISNPHLVDIYPTGLPADWLVANQGGGIEADHNGLAPAAAGSGEVLRFTLAADKVPCLDPNNTWFATADGLGGLVLAPDEVAGPDFCP
jgi:hypothetical protein